MLVALYARVSTREQALHGNSIPEQNDRMVKFCEAMNWEVFDTYTDAGFSGAKLDRPELQRLIRDVRKGKIQKVIVYKLDRLSRSQKDTLHLIEDVFLANNVDFVSMNENFDTSSAFGRAMIGILAVFAQLEREQIKERMMMGREARAKRGDFSRNRFIPIGYDFVDGDLIPNEAEKPIIQKIFRDVADGIQIPTIVRNLNKAGLYHRYGKWTRNRIKNMVTRKTYIGYISFSGEWHKGHHEPLIDEETFFKAQTVFKDRSEEYKSKHIRIGKAQSYLAGTLYCKSCGGKCRKRSYHRSGGDYNYYICNNCTPPTSWKMETLDELIFNEIRKLTLESLNEVRPDRVDEKKVIEKKLTEVEKQISKLMDLYGLDRIPLDTLQDKIQALNDQRDRLEDELINIEDDEKEQLSRKDAFKMINSFGDILDRGNFDEIRTVILTLIDKIELSKDDVDIYWAFY